MSFTAALPESSVSGTPGRVAGSDVVVANRSDTAQTFRIEVRGEAAAWALVLPDQLTVPPAAEGRARLTFAVPEATAVRPGRTRFAVRIRGESGRSVEIPGAVHVAEVPGVRLGVSPMIARGRRRARHTVTVENRGNVRARVDLEAVEPRGAVALALSPATFVLAPGERAEARLSASARRFCLDRRGRSHPFTVMARPERGDAVAAQVVFHQDPRRWRTPTAIAVVLAVLVLLVAAGGGDRPRGTPGPPALAAAPALPAVPASCASAVADDPAHVRIAGFAFCPSSVTVVAGTEVAWTNDDLALHTATSASDERPFDSGSLDRGGSFRTRFDEPGRYEYYCRFHPAMRGTIVVT